MSYETKNLSRVVAEGFFAVYVKPNEIDEERQVAIENLASILEIVYAQGMNRGQMEFTLKLVKVIGIRSEVPANELISLASIL